jgi:hypothetical protein
VFKTIDFADGGIIGDYETSVEAYVSAAEANLRAHIPTVPRPFRAYAGGSRRISPDTAAPIARCSGSPTICGGDEARLSYFHRHIGD